MPSDDPYLLTFLSGAFSAELIDRLDYMRPGLDQLPGERLASLQQSFHDLIVQRSMDLLTWVRATDLDFETEGEMYEYLQGCYEYLFEGAESFPDAPL